MDRKRCLWSVHSPCILSSARILASLLTQRDSHGASCSVDPRIPGHLMAAGPPLSSVVLPHSISCQWTSCTWEARGSSGSHQNTGQHHGFALEAVGAPHQEAPKPQSRAGGLGRRLPYKVCTPPGNGLAEPLNRKTLSVGSFYRRH